MKANTKSQNPHISAPNKETPKNRDKDMEGLYKAMGVLTKECENTRNSAAISVSKCYASTTALVELLVERGLLKETDHELYLLKSLRNFHKSSLEDIEAGLAELESGKSVTAEHVIKGMKEEHEYHTEILAKITEVESDVANGSKTYHQFIKELSDYLNKKYDLK